jgi:hypothetical protein
MQLDTVHCLTFSKHNSSAAEPLPFIGHKEGKVHTESGSLKRADYMYLMIYTIICVISLS